MTTDHTNKTGSGYDQARVREWTPEQRLAASEKAKAFNAKSSKLSQMTNTRLKALRKLKP